MSIPSMLAEDLVERVPGVFGVWAAAARKRIHFAMSRDGSMGQRRHERLEDMDPWTHHRVNVQHPNPNNPSTNSTSHHTCTDYYNTCNATPGGLLHHTTTSYDTGWRWRSDSAFHHSAAPHLYDIGYSSTAHTATNHHDHSRTYNNSTSHSPSVACGLYPFRPSENRAFSQHFFKRRC